jgi:hypothetical protein
VQKNATEQIDYFPLSYVAFFCSCTNVNRKHKLPITDAALLFEISFNLFVIRIPMPIEEKNFVFASGRAWGCALFLF